MRLRTFWCATLLALGLAPAAGAKGRWKAVYKWSVGALVASNAADVITTMSCRHCGEMNPLVRNSTGGFAAGRGVLIKTAVVGGGLLLQRHLLKKNCGESDYKFMSFVNFASSGTIAAVAARNVVVARKQR